MSGAEKFHYLFAMIGLGFISGFSFTAGMWLFCKAVRWAPVNTAVHLHMPDATGEIRREKI